jgi:hypothetical protein
MGQFFEMLGNANCQFSCAGSLVLHSFHSILFYTGEEGSFLCINSSSIHLRQYELS